MRLFHGTDNAEIQRPTVLTLGVFDGLHLGHQLVMSTVAERARALNAVPTVITFDPHPRAVLHPESAPPLLQTLDQKVEGFGVLGIEQTIVVRLHAKSFRLIRAEDFLRDVVKERLHAKEVYLGCGFAFGHNREGNIELLTKRERRISGFSPTKCRRFVAMASASARARFARCWRRATSIWRGACWVARTASKDALSMAQSAGINWAFRLPTCTRVIASYPGTEFTSPAP